MANETDDAVRVKDAAKRAKSWLVALFAEEKITDVGLEEVKLQNGEWDITLRFSRPADPGPFLKSVLGERERAYKVVKFSADTGQFIAVVDREAA